MTTLVHSDAKSVSVPSQTEANGFSEAFKRWLFGSDALAVARSLRDEPGAWSGDERYMGRPYELTHASGVGLWVANRTYGMSVRTPGQGCETGVTFLSTFYLSPRHHFLRKAADKWLSARPNLRKTAADYLAGAYPAKATGEASA